MKRKQSYSPDDNLDELVFDFQNGNEEAGLQLLEKFGGHPAQKEMTLFLGKYFRMLRLDKLDLKDRDSRLFISHFLDDEGMRDELRKSYQYKPTQAAARRKLSNLVHSLRVLDDEEFKQELRFMFLKKVKTYKKIKDRIDFNGYIYNAYRHEVARFIKGLLNPDEMYVKFPKLLMRIAEDRLKDDENVVDVQDDIFIQAPMVHTEEELDNNWVRGLTCGEEFKDLTTLQRLILKLNYEEGWSDGKIADMMGIHINTIFRQRKKAGLIVQQAVEKLIQEGYYQ